MFCKIIFSVCCFIPVALLAQDTFKLSSGAELKLTGGVIITLENMHLDNDGTISLAAGDGSFRFSGNITTNILGGNMPMFDVMEITKNGGAQLTLQRNINVVSGINFISGLFNLNNNNILLQPAALLNGESETSRITGTNGGVVEITKVLNAPALENPGNLGAIFTSSQNFGSTIIRRGHIAQTIAAGISITRYFDIAPTNNAALSATLRFQYRDAELNGLDENSVVLWKSPDNINWTAIGFDSRNTTTNHVEKTGIADFSRWTLNKSSGPLPVVFISINARCDNGKIILTWKTAREINSSSFNIERSINGTNWAVIGSVQAAGNSQAAHTYTFTDISPVASVAMYRIVEHDLDGRKQYTSIVRSACNDKEDIRVWPNPVDDIAWLNIYSNGYSPVLIQIYDSKGALVLIQKTNLLQGSNLLTVPVEKLAQGIYELKVDYKNGKTKTFRLVKH
jgi:hypothetical protein